MPEIETRQARVFSCLWWYLTAKSQAKNHRAVNEKDSCIEALPEGNADGQRFPVSFNPIIPLFKESGNV